MEWLSTNDKPKTMALLLHWEELEEDLLTETTNANKTPMANEMALSLPSWKTDWRVLLCKLCSLLRIQ